MTPQMTQDFNKYYHPEEPSELKAFETGYELCLYREVERTKALVAELERLKARFKWIDSGFGDLDFHREEHRHKGPKRGEKASYYWMRRGVDMVLGGNRHQIAPEPV